MNKRIAKKWAKVLRSGKYKQGRGLLKQNGESGIEHCCLGVLCELYDEEMRKKHKRTLTKSAFGPDYNTFTFDNYDDVLPPIVQKWSEMKSDIGEYDSKTNGPYIRTLSLADLNDDEERSFKYIANVIEKNVEKL